MTPPASTVTSYPSSAAIATAFRSRTVALKVYAGADALASLPEELARNGVERALVLCGRSVHERTPLTRRISALLGSRLAGIFPDIPEGAPVSCIEAACDMARQVQADGLIAVGAGSVIKGARVVAMLLGEGRPLEAMATVHEEGKAPVSQRLDRPKLPIFNVPTSPTNAQNRGGSAVRLGGTVHQLEFFDPKTRPRALFWDEGALATAPLHLARSTSFEIYWWSLMCMAAVDRANPLVQASRRQAWTLAHEAYPRLGQAGADAPARIALCAAALLQSRDEDDGGWPWSSTVFGRAAYASAVAVFNQYPGRKQPEGYSGFTPAALRCMGHLDPQATVALGRALGLTVTTMEPDLSERVARAAEAHFSRIGWPISMAGAGIPETDVDTLLGFALRNYNANHDRLLTTHAPLLRTVIRQSIAAPAPAASAGPKA